MLGLNWKKLAFNSNGVATNFKELVVDPIQAFCSLNVDVGSVLGGLISIFDSISEKVAAKTAALLTKHLYGASCPEGRPFGEIMRETRLKCLADGLLLAMGVCAFGDADWKVVVQPRA